MISRYALRVATAGALLAAPVAFASPTYFSNAWIQVTSITGNVQWSQSISLPSLNVTAGVDQPGGTDSKEKQFWGTYSFSPNGSDPVKIQIDFQYGHQFNIAPGDYASATSSLMALTIPGGQGSSGSFYTGAWQYYGRSEYSWQDGPSGTLTLTGPAEAGCLMLGLSAWAYYDPPCNVPGPASLGLCLAGSCAIGLIRARTRRPAERTVRHD
ncbi:MAG: hypothetical protein QHH07_08285 [Sedimentisphaerales bacterium]|nr:hypothetical protein [Sedimentisphaerales bacterium]